MTDRSLEAARESRLNRESSRYISYRVDFHQDPTTPSSPVISRTFGTYKAAYRYKTGLEHEGFRPRIVRVVSQ